MPSLFRSPKYSSSPRVWIWSLESPSPSKAYGRDDIGQSDVVDKFIIGQARDFLEKRLGSEDFAQFELYFPADISSIPKNCSRAQALERIGDIGAAPQPLVAPRIHVGITGASQPRRRLRPISSASRTPREIGHV